MRRPRKSPHFPYTTFYESLRGGPPPGRPPPRAGPAGGWPPETGRRTHDGPGPLTTEFRTACARAARRGRGPVAPPRSEEHTSELQSRQYLVCRLLLEKKMP